MVSFLNEICLKFLDHPLLKIFGEDLLIDLDLRWDPREKVLYVNKASLARRTNPILDVKIAIVL